MHFLQNDFFANISRKPLKIDFNCREKLLSIYTEENVLYIVE